MKIDYGAEKSKLSIIMTNLTIIFNIGALPPEPAFAGTQFTILVPDDSRTFGIGAVYLAEGRESATVDWGDGSEPTVLDGDASQFTHEYAAGGRYTVSFSDDVRSISVNSSKTPEEYLNVYTPMIERVVSTAETLTTIPSRAFKGATSLVEARFKSVSMLPAPNATNVQFVGCDALREIHFAAANEEAIKATTGWARSEGTLGAENATIRFDL